MISKQLGRRRRIEPVFRILVAAFLFGIFCSGAAAADCRPSTSDLEWLGKTIDVWKKVRSGPLGLPAAKSPWMVLFDKDCVLNLNPDPKFFAVTGTAETLRLGGDALKVYTARHAGTIELPDGGRIPAKVISFAANYNGDRGSFFTAALPSIWAQAENLKDEPRLPSLIRAVYVHELTHTYHRNVFARLTAIEKQLTDVEKFDDDIVQNRFGKDAGFRDAYTAEIAMAQQAVSMNPRRDKKQSAKRLLRSILDRRAKFYTGENAKFAEIEDIFLTLEGVANWAGYRSALENGLSSEDAQRLIRGDGKYWSQEEGILLFLLIDSLVPNWQKAAFGDGLSIVQLLERASS